MDAGRLDTELTNMLLEQFLKAFALVKPVRFKQSTFVSFAVHDDSTLSGLLVSCEAKKEETHEAFTSWTDTLQVCRDT